MRKDPRFFTPEVDHSMNIINECDKEEHSRMRRMLSFAFSTSNLLVNEDVLIRRTDELLDVVGSFRSGHSKRGMDIVQIFNYVTFNIMGEMSFGDSWDSRLNKQPGLSLHSSVTPGLTSSRASLSLGRRDCQHNLHERRHACRSLCAWSILLPGMVSACSQQKNTLQTC